MNSFLAKLYGYEGDYSLPYLIHLFGTYKDEDGISRTVDMRFINDTKDVEYNNQVYKAEAFSYTPKASEFGLTGGGTLEISVTDNKTINLIELCTEITLEITGLLMSDGSVVELKHFKHKNGKVTADREKATFSFDRDQRLDMTFPALVWNAQNNRGNA